MKDLIKIIKHYGFNPQIRKLNEEVLELSEQLFIIDWLNDYKRNLTPRQYKSMYDARKNNVEEEFADVLVLLEQFKVYLELDDNKIKEIYDFKIKRTINSIKKGNK